MIKRKEEKGKGSQEGEDTEGTSLDENNKSDLSHKNLFVYHDRWSVDLIEETNTLAR